MNLFGVLCSVSFFGVPSFGATLPDTQPLSWTGDLSVRMVAGIDRFLTAETEKSIGERPKYWRRDFASAAAYEKSIQPNRERLRRMLGAMEERTVSADMAFVGGPRHSPIVADTKSCTVFAVRWPVFENVFGEGLLLQPKRPHTACIVAIPDADQTPEMLVGLTPGLPADRQFARLLAEDGCQVVVPTLVSRANTFSGNERLGLKTRQPHREWIHRQAFELGRHLLGYEIQKIQAVVDWFVQDAGGPRRPIGLVGFSEGGQTAFYAAALDARIDGAFVGDYFDSRQRLWEEPIDHNLFGLLREFGDAEIASLIAPRRLWLELTTPAKSAGEVLWKNAPGETPGMIRRIERKSFIKEVERTTELVKPLFAANPSLAKDWLDNHAGVPSPAGESDSLPERLRRFLHSLSAKAPVADSTIFATKRPPIAGVQDGTVFYQPDPQARQRRQVGELVEHTQRLLERSEKVRDAFWSRAKPTSLAAWQSATVDYRRIFKEEILGVFAESKAPPNPRTRKIRETPRWVAYEVVLDVYPEVFTRGWLLIPKDLAADERRPVVVCQHGLEGIPEDTVTDDLKSIGFHYYQAFAARLAERGFITYAPHCPYRGGDAFRILQRKANPLGKSLYSIIVAQQEVQTGWLASLPFVDPKRIAFYGLSYGGKTAMRVPAVVDRYCLSICSADFNEWIRKIVTIEEKYSYMYTHEYEMLEWNLGRTFNYAELAGLIAPRPFMVERGHFDGVGVDEWVAYEYAKIRRLYAQLGIPERTEIEFFNGPHQIHATATFDFLHRHLQWPKR